MKVTVEAKTNLNNKVVWESWTFNLYPGDVSEISDVNGVVFIITAHAPSEPLLKRLVHALKRLIPPTHRIKPVDLHPVSIVELYKIIR